MLRMGCVTIDQLLNRMAGAEHDIVCGIKTVSHRDPTVSHRDPTVSHRDPTVSHRDPES